MFFLKIKLDYLCKMFVKIFLSIVDKYFHLDKYFII